MFELLLPENRYAVKQNSKQILLHGVRDMTSLDEIDPLSISVFISHLLWLMCLYFGRKSTNGRQSQ